MKTILAVLMMMTVAVAAQAKVGPDSTWEQIYQAHLWPEFKKEQFHNTFVPVKSTCVDGDSLVATVRNVRVSKPLSASETICTEVVNDGKCARYETYTRQIPLNYDVPVYSNYGHQTSPVLQFTKSFSIPSCQ